MRIQCLGISGFAAPVQHIQAQVSGILGVKIKPKLSFLSNSAPRNKRGSGRRWAETVPANSILFLTLQGSQQRSRGCPCSPNKG